MSKTLTITLLSGYQENDDALFAVRLAEAALKAGHKVNIFLYGSASAMAEEEHEVVGRLRVSEQLKKHMDISLGVGKMLEELAEKGAVINTCHTTEYGRGVEGDEYREGIEWGDVGGSFTGFLAKSDVHISIGH